MKVVDRDERSLRAARRMPRRDLVLAAFCVSLAGCGRWRPNTPIEVQLRRQAEPDLFSRVLSALRARGYAVAEQDPKNGYLRIAAKTTGSIPVNGGLVETSGGWFGLQIYADKLVLRASGYLVRDNDTIRRSTLDDEMQQLADQLETDIGR
jgi:hypothetical protein